MTSITKLHVTSPSFAVHRSTGPPVHPLERCRKPHKIAPPRTRLARVEPSVISRIPGGTDAPLHQHDGRRVRRRSRPAPSPLPPPRKSRRAGGEVVSTAQKHLVDHLITIDSIQAATAKLAAIKTQNPSVREFANTLADGSRRTRRRASAGRRQAGRRARSRCRRRDDAGVREALRGARIDAGGRRIRSDIPGNRGRESSGRDLDDQLMARSAAKDDDLKKDLDTTTGALQEHVAKANELAGDAQEGRRPDVQAAPIARARDPKLLHLQRRLTARDCGDVSTRPWMARRSLSSHRRSPMSSRSLVPLVGQAVRLRLLRPALDFTDRFHQWPTRPSASSTPPTPRSTSGRAPPSSTAAATSPSAASPPARR